jgi:hypothetical protein
MAFSDLEKAMYAYIVGRVLPKGTTRMAAKAALAAAVTAGRALSPVAQRGAAAALPPVARAIANPYVGVPLGLATAAYGTQRYLDESGMQEEINVVQDEVLRYFSEDVPRSGRKTKKRIKSTYNRAVSKAMKAVKASAKGGPKGKFTNAKKTFGQVSKAVSKASKGGKLSPKGVTGVIKRSISGLFKPKAKRRTSTKPTYTFRTN